MCADGRSSMTAATRLAPCRRTRSARSTLTPIRSVCRKRRTEPGRVPPIGPSCPNPPLLSQTERAPGPGRVLATTGDFRMQAVWCLAGQMAKTTGDERFERYLREHGYDPGPHEPSLVKHGIDRRPDFLPRRGGRTVACEVKQFKAGASDLERRLARQQIAAGSP